MSQAEAAKTPQLVVIVARQRSGTTALAESLALNASAESFGEVFHHRQNDADAGRAFRIRPEAGYFNFRADMLRLDPDLSLPSVANQTRLFDAYLDHLSSMTDKRWLVLDIKYNSWHHFEHFYAIPGNTPFLLHLLKQRKAGFIHLTRSGSFARYCSEQVALTAGLWHVERGSANGTASITIDPALALADMVESRRQIEIFSRFLNPVRRRVELRYEETFAGDRLVAAAELKLKRLFDGDWQGGVQVPLQKLTPPLAKVVKNRDEVLAYFKPTTFWPEVAAALASPVES